MVVLIVLYNVFIIDSFRLKLFFDVCDVFFCYKGLNICFKLFLLILVCVVFVIFIWVCFDGVLFIYMLIGL